MINEKSLLRFPPKNLNPKQVVVFNAITFSVDICQIAFEELIKELLQFSDSPKSSGNTFPKIFSNVWVIINNVTIFRNLICSHFDILDSDSSLEEFNKAKKIRNSNQHIDERISEILTLRDLPIYGSLSWYRNIKNTNKIQQFFLYSGTFTHQRNVGGEIIIPRNENTYREIDELIFTCVSKQNNNSYPEITISLYRIMEDLKIWIEHFDNQIDEQLKDFDTSDRHNSNLYFQINGHWE